MPLDKEERYEVSEMIEHFHKAEVLPLHRENIERLTRVEKALSTLVIRTDTTRDVLEQVEKKKSRKQDLMIALLTLLLLLLTYLGFSKERQQSKLRSENETQQSQTHTAEPDSSVANR